MAATATESYTIRIEASGTINDVDFKASGEGRGDPREGNPSVSITYSAIPKGSHPFGNFIAIINMLSLTLSKEIPPAKSLLTLAGGNFEFERTVKGPEIDLQSRGSMRRIAPKTLLLSSRIEGKLNVPPLRGVEPWEAVMVPLKEGEVLETMIVNFLAEGRSITAYVVSNYKFAPLQQMQGPQIRRVELTPSAKDQTFVGKFRALVKLPTASRTS